MQLRDYQQEAVDATLNYFAHSAGNPVVAMPTGTGKSLVIGGTLEAATKLYPGTRTLVLTHVKELVEQNAAKLARMWPQAPMGIYSAGLKQRDTVMPIIFGGVASVAGCVSKFGRRDLLLIDECHLLSPNDDTMYQNVIAELQETNPYLKVIGYSATPFRLKQGMITDGGIFTDICCDMTGVAAFNRFIKNGHLVPLYPKRTKVERQAETTSLGSNGDFSTASLAADAAQKDITYQALIELCEAGEDRNAWLIFSATIDDAEYIATVLNSFGIPTAVVHSKLPNGERDRRIADYKAGLLRCLVTKDMLTTGFDHPPLDMIGMLRRTMSPGLWVQMLGRGTRPSPETNKTDCLVLDFAGNTRRLGPINDPVIPRKKGKGGGDAPVRICEHCGTYNHAAARVCCFCAEEFTFAPKIVATADTQELIRSDMPTIEKFDVMQAFYYLHEKIGRPPQIKVEYSVNGGAHRFIEFVQFEHQGLSRKRARDWWRARFPGTYLPETTAEALKEITQLRVPRIIHVWVNKRHPEIMGYEY